MTEAAWKFDRETDGKFLKTLELHQIEKEVFRRRLKAGMNCDLSKAELDALLPLFENNGFVDGYEFVITFYHLRFEYKGMVEKKLIEHNRRFREATAAEFEKRQEKFVEKYAVKLKSKTTEDDLSSAIEKLADAAAKYDSMAPGGIPLDAFKCVSMRPEEFKHQLKLLFNIKYTVRELSALVHHLGKETDDDLVRCAEFLVFFVRLGFTERSRLNSERWQLEKRREDHDKRKRGIEQEKQEKQHALKVKVNFAAADAEEAIAKLREAARLYDIQVDCKRCLRAFTAASMPAHTFKDQLKINFNVTLTAGELGALVEKFKNGDGDVDSVLFEKSFLALYAEEREREMREVNERQKKVEEQRKEEHKRTEDEKAAKHAKTISFQFGEQDMQTAVQKLKDAAYRFDKNIPGCPSLGAFATASITAFDFREQLKRLFNLRLKPRELGALLTYFNADEQGNVACNVFLMQFLKMGYDERQERVVRDRLREQEVAERRAEEDAQKAKRAEDKLVVRVKAYSEDDFSSAMAKLTEAAFLYDRSNPGAMGLQGFQGISMTPTVFREQIKRVFGLMVTRGELGALVSFFDKNETGVVSCKEFIDKFLRMGMLERDKVSRMGRNEQKLKEDKELAKQRAREEEDRQRALRSINFDFSESDFDVAVARFVHTCQHFDPRTLGPMGWASITADKLPFSEFKALLKLQFVLLFSPPELGAFVMFCDPSFQAKGYVSCRAFINVFLQTKLQLESFKGRPDEVALVKQYQEQLKTAYQSRLKRVRARADPEGSDGESLSKPWRGQAQPLVRASSASPQRSAVVPGGAGSNHSSRPTTAGATRALSGRGRGGVVLSIKRQKLPRPVDAVEKLKLRLTVGRDTGRMDLSTKIVWPQDEEERPRRTALVSRSQESLFTERSVEYGLTGAPPRIGTGKQSRAVTPYRREGEGGLEGGLVPEGSSVVHASDVDKLLSSCVFDQSTVSDFGMVGDSAFDSPKPSKLQSESLKEGSEGGGVSEEGSDINMATYLGKDFAVQQVQSSSSSFGGAGGMEESKSDSVKIRNYQIPDARNGYEFSKSTDGGSLVLRRLPDPDATAAEQEPSATSSATLAKKKGLDLTSLSLTERSIASKKAEEKRVSAHLALGARLECGFSVEFTLAAVPDQVFLFTHLTELWLCNNLISLVPPQIGELKSLKTLSLTGNFVEHIPEELCTLNSLERLYMGGNRLCSLPLAFQFLGSLLELDLKDNELVDFPDVVCLNKRLQHLDMSGNRISALPPSLSSLKHLMSLFLWETAIPAPPPVLQKMTSCVVLGCPLPSASHRALSQQSLFPALDDNSELESFLRHRASSRIAARLRRRKPKGASSKVAV